MSCKPPRDSLKTCSGHAKAEVALANADVLSLCGAGPVDVKVVHIVLVHCGDPLVGVQPPSVIDTDHLGPVSCQWFVPSPD